MFDANGMAPQRDHHLIAVDLGSHRIRVAVFDFDDPDQAPEVVGFRCVKSEGIRSGGVVDLEAAAAALNLALEGAAQMADLSPERAVLLVNGSSLVSEPAQGTVGLTTDKVDSSDCERALHAARQALSQRSRDRRLHEVINHYSLDGRQRIRDPEHLKAGRRLQANLLGIGMARSSVQNLISVVEATGLEVEAVVSPAYTTGLSVLEERQRRLGTALVEIGARTTTLSVWSGEELRQVACLGIGGWDLSMAIAKGLLLPLDEAERLKREQGGALEEGLPDEPVEMATLGLRPPRILNRRFLAQALQDPLAQLFDWIGQQVTSTGLAMDLDCGLVLCGGGSRLEGLADYAEEFLGVETRIVRRCPLGGLGTMLEESDGVALAGLALLHQADRLHLVGTAPRRKKVTKSWFGGLFARP